MSERCTLKTLTATLCCFYQKSSVMTAKSSQCVVDLVIGSEVPGQGEMNAIKLIGWSERRRRRLQQAVVMRRVAVPGRRTLRSRSLPAA
ncbi:hypothetical protein D4764_07G0010600 [Takifugu flavidus]|uniref:Uncharacterized protein n=1 Tax=Takifugu flavidus TaxID=433684 RepID=A0A5C6MW50_9TELE|nr:hypothetical protein D4764_07G0010600 [Takifugu flavidus]